MEAKLDCDVDVEGPVDMTDRAEKRDTVVGDGCMMRRGWRQVGAFACALT
jgi:hypothetical protein